MVNIYKLKHIPTGLYYRPLNCTSSNLSKRGKIYQTNINELLGNSDAITIRISKKISILNGRLEDCCNYTNSSLEKEYYEWISCPSIYDSSQLWGFTLRHCDYRDDYIDNDSMFINYETALVYGEFRAISYIKSIT